MRGQDIRPVWRRGPGPRFELIEPTTEGPNDMLIGDLLVLAIIVLPIVLTFAALRAKPLRFELATDVVQELTALI
jgi:hypothetical protein